MPKSVIVSKEQCAEHVLYNCGLSATILYLMKEWGMSLNEVITFLPPIQDKVAERLLKEQL